MEDKIKEKIEELRTSLIYYIRNFYNDDIISEKERIEIDLTEIYKFGLIDFVEFIHEHPKEGLKLIEKCYQEAYFSLKNEYPKYIITIKNLPETFKKIKNKNRLLTISDIKSHTIGKLVEFEGIVVTATKIKTVLKKAKFTCSKCGNENITKYIDNPFEIFEEPRCEKCGSDDLILIENECEYMDFQEIKVQQPLDLMDDPEEPPKYITVFLENSPGIYCGRVKITGIPIKIQKNKKIPIYDIYIKGINCEVLDDEIEMELNRDDIENIEKISKLPNVVDLLSDRLIPEIKGHSVVKKAVFLQQIKGVKKGNKRADIHILLITDPGIGKTVILRRISELPGNLYGSVTTASGVGLTAAVVREKTEIGDDTWVIKPGLLVKANKGTACIDELTVNKDLQSYVLEAMESQTIHISKGGINAKLPAECAILAACNPRWGRFDLNISVAEQINIPAPLLSRFDLIFPIRDEPDRAKDKEIAEHIIDIHRAHLDKEINKEIGLEHIEIEGVKVDIEFIIKYIAYARQKNPIISEEAKKLLVNYYLNMRKGTIQVTARQLEAAIRLAEAHAKAKLKDVVDEEDAKEAINIITECLKQIAYDPDTGQFDIDKITGVSKKDRDKMMAVYEIIKKLAEKKDDGLALHEDVVELCEKEGIDEEDVERIIKKLIKNGDIDEPKPGKYRLM
ncbi:ATP-binding protein [Methanotorris formicicus]|uniref:MCM family protein n=1 Tax=Methanotorris formicicus Mc-S-70 TaxID=647171 RepID=H1KYD2_9EURY|nr:minichromosome maintenance protein MCM [Methanotorris formicicus]EHP87216.1 MCM family protein [Methanotorris formicicus Mc-S-70]